MTKLFKNKQEKGITLIALVVTIIVLLILAGISINMITGNNSIIKKAGEAKEKTEQSILEEEVGIAVYEKTLDNGNTIEPYLKKISGATVEKLAQDTYYVTRGSAAVTVDDEGEITKGKVEVWDGSSVECPKFAVENNIWHWYIYNAKQLKFFADFVNNGNALTEDQEKMVTEEKYNKADIKITEETIVYLMNNIDLGARLTNGEWDTEENARHKWSTIGKLEILPSAINDETDLPFKGKLEGKNNFIKGLYINEETDYAGLFGIVKNIENLNIKDSYIKGTRYTGAIAGCIYGGEIKNCNNINTKVEGTGQNTGGVIGYASSSTLCSCSNSGTITESGRSSRRSSEPCYKKHSRKFY